MLLEFFDGYPRLLERIHNYTCLDAATVRRQDKEPSSRMAQHVVTASCSHHDIAKTLERLYRLGCSDVPKLAASQRRKRYAETLSCVRRQRVQTFSRSD